MAALTASSRSTIAAEQSDQEIVKCVVIGDSGVGKTKLVCARATKARYTLQNLMQIHVPTVWAIDHYTTDREIFEMSRCVVDGVSVSLRLWDTFGYHDKDRRFAYGRADVVLLCFSVVRPASLKNAKRIWYKEIKKCCPDVPIIVVGCQIDLRYLYKEKSFVDLDKGPFFRPIQESEIIYPSEGRAFAKSIGASYYEETVLTGFGVKDVFDNVVRAALIKRSSGRFWISGLKHVHYPMLQEPQVPPAPEAPCVYAPKDTLQQDFTEFLGYGAFHDAFFNVRGQLLKVHKVMLCAASPSLSAILSNNYGECRTTELTNLNSDKTSLLDSDSLVSSSQSSPHFLDHPLFEMVSIQTTDKNKDLPVFYIRPHVLKDTIEVLLHFVYSGELLMTKCNVQVFQQLLDICDQLKIQELYEIVSTFLSSDVIRTFTLPRNKYLQRRTENLLVYGLQQLYFTDITFVLDDGEVQAHRMILAARCDYMKAMLEENFKEGILCVVHFPGVLQGTFNTLLHLLYSGSLTDITHNCFIEIIELANQFCLPDVVAIVECAYVQRLSALHLEGRDVVAMAVNILEAAQLFNANQLADWCLHFLSMNFLQLFKRHYKELCELSEPNKMYLNKNRWPPLWYLKEIDFYKKTVSAMHSRVTSKSPPVKKRKPQKQAGNANNSNGNSINSTGCLCFAHRSRKLSRSSRHDVAIVQY